MTHSAHLRRELRPQGAVARSCLDCVLYDRCGGIETPDQLFGNSCFDLHCCGRDDCSLVCRYNRHWERDMQELGGLRFEHLPQVHQRPVSLPQYIPLIHHGYCHRLPLAWPVVALTTGEVFRLKGGHYLAVADDAAELRSTFWLAPETRVVLRGTDDDPVLERYWDRRQLDRVPEQMSRLGVDLVIAPNFSHPLNVVRTETLANRMRQLICLDELQRAGVSPVPHLSAVQPADWRFWESYLRDRPGIHFVAKEFQTGDKEAAEGRRVIERVAAIRDAIGRPLHLIAVGGGQFVVELAARIGQFTLIDSAPFMKTVKRRVFVHDRQRPTWRMNRTAEGQPLDELLTANLASYTDWITKRVHSATLSRPQTRIPLRVHLP